MLLFFKTILGYEVCWHPVSEKSNNIFTGIFLFHIFVSLLSRLFMEILFSYSFKKVELFRRRDFWSD